MKKKTASTPEETTVDTVALEKTAPSKPVLKRAVYSSVYAVSFGTVFTSLLVKKLIIPKGGVIDNALHDGAAAAIEAVEEKQKVIAEAIEETKDFFTANEEAPAAT